MMTDQHIIDKFSGASCIGDKFCQAMTIPELQRGLLLAASGRFFLSSVDAAAVETYVRRWARNSDYKIVVAAVGKQIARRLCA